MHPNPAQRSNRRAVKNKIRHCLTTGTDLTVCQSKTLQIPKSPFWLDKLAQRKGGGDGFGVTSNPKVSPIRKFPRQINLSFRF
jgi:hypothetical protein